MPLIVTGLPKAILPSGGTASNAVGLFDDAWGLTVYTPSTITSTSGLQVQVEPTSTGTNFVILQSGGTDVYVPQSRATVISPVPFQQIRFVSSVVEAQTDTITLTKAVLT
jgi:hypothetical protein